MIKLPSPGFILQAFVSVVTRYPLVMLAALQALIAVMFLIEGSGRPEEVYMRCWMIGQLGIPALLGASIWSSSNEKSPMVHWGLQFLIVLALGGYFMMLHPEGRAFEYNGLPQYLALQVIAHLFVSVAPYLNQRAIADFWSYNRQIFTNLVIGAAFTVIMFAGLSAALLAVNELFDLNIHGENYARLFAFLGLIFNTSYFLFHLPVQYDNLEQQDGEYNVVFRNLCKFILIPIVALYFFILYAYGTKILLQWNLPRGWVSSLVIGFSVVGIFTYLLNYLLPKYDSSGLVSIYRRLFWWVLLPLTVLLFVAIGRRLSDYGITEERYLVAHVGVWMASMCVYFLLSKRDNIKFIPISLAVFTLAYAFGPFGAHAVSIRNQVSRLQDVLTRNQRLEGMKVKADGPEISIDDRAKINGVLEYLDRRDELGQIASWLPMPPDSFPTTPNSWSAASNIAVWLGAPNPYVLGTPPLEDGFQTITLYSNEQQSGYPLPQDGGRIMSFYTSAGDENQAASLTEGYQIRLNADKQNVTLRKFEQGTAVRTETFALKPALNAWLAGNKDLQRNISPDSLYYDFKGEQFKLRILVQQATLLSNDKEVKCENMSGFMCVKE